MTMARRRRNIAWVIALVAVVGCGVGVTVARSTDSQQTLPKEPPATVDSRPVVPVAIIGDSYTVGSDMGGVGKNNWAKLVHRKLDHRAYYIPYRVYAEGGAGYANPGQQGSTFLQLAEQITANTAIVVVFGSRNDTAVALSSVKDAAENFYRAIRTAAPKAQLIVIGPPWVDENVPASIVDIRDALRAATNDAGAVFVDPLTEGWFFGQDSVLIGADHIHPTDDGHTYLANKILPAISALFPPIG